MKAAFALVFLFSSAVFAYPNVKLRCWSKDQASDLHVLVNEDSAKITEIESGKVVSYVRNRSYVPRRGDKVQFVGKDGFYTVKFIIDRAVFLGGVPLHSGGMGSFARHEGTQDSYWSVSYTCRFKN